MSWFFISGCQNIEALASVLPMNIQVWFSLWLTGLISLQSKGLSRVFSSTTRSSAFSKTSLNIWKFMVHILLKPALENFEHYFTSVWDECIVQESEHSLALPSLGLEWKLTFSSPVATAEFSKCAGIYTASSFRIEIAQLEFHHIH